MKLSLSREVARDAALSILPYGHLVNAFQELGDVPHPREVQDAMDLKEGLKGFLFCEDLRG